MKVLYSAMTNRWGNNGISDGLYLLRLQKYCRWLRHLLLGRKAMTKLDSILKSRDFTLLTEVHVVKALCFPVVMYGCESWTIRRLRTEELMLLSCGVGQDLRVP